MYSNSFCFISGVCTTTYWEVWPYNFQNKKLNVQTIQANMIFLHSIPYGQEWVLVMHNSQHSHENSGSLREFPDKSLTWEEHP